MTQHKCVLITGTTSGLGKAMMENYLAEGSRVICVNRRRDQEFEDAHPKAEFHSLDITSIDSVRGFVREIERAGHGPSLFVLSAGINKIDNVEGFNYPIFREVMETNLFGVMTFLGAISELGLSGRTILGMSSTSNIVPNPGHLGYFLSKISIKDGFELMAKNDPKNKYRSVILGPVYTNIMKGYPNPSGLQGKIFNALAVPADTAVKSIVGFLNHSSGRHFYYPMRACLFYYFIRILLKFLPGLYKGSQPQSKPQLTNT